MDPDKISSEFASMVASSDLDACRDFVLGLSEPEQVLAAIDVLNNLMTSNEPKAFYIRAVIHRWYGEKHEAGHLFLKAGGRGVGSAYYFASQMLSECDDLDDLEGYSFCDLVRFGMESGHVWSRILYDKHCTNRDIRSRISSYFFRFLVAPVKLAMGLYLPKYRDWMRYY